MRIIAFFVFLVITSFTVYANDSKESSYGFSLGWQTGFVHGQAFELVYPGSEGAKGEFLSELKWGMKPVFYIGIKADFGKLDIMSAPGFFASASFKAGIPTDSGIMEDRDWLPEGNGALTNFSSHTNKTKELYMADILLGASIPVKSILYIKPFLSGSWMHFSFSGRDGYGKYASDNWEVIPFYGEVISYQQDWFLAAAGFSIGTEILRPFLFELSFKISPFTYCTATDHHKSEAKKVEYKDFSSFGFYIEPEINVSFLVDKLELSLGCAYRHIGKTEGKTYFKEDGKTNYSLSSNKSGAGLSILDTRLLFSMRF